MRRVPLALLVVLLFPAAGTTWSLLGCTAAQKAAFADFGLCSAQQVLVPSLASLGEQLGRDDWKSWGWSALRGAMAGGAACGLKALTTVRTQAEPLGPTSPANLVHLLATYCEEGPCTDVRERAAFLLLRAEKEGLVKLPGGQG